jgi:uncharacterized protein (TIGR02231 family)
MRTLLVLAGLAAVARAQEAPRPRETPSEIRRVTVYPDRALVTREGKLDVPAGTSVFEFANLPAGVDSESVRARVPGNDGVKLRGVEVKTYQVEKVAGDALKALTDRREKLGEDVLGVTDRLAALASRREFILSLKAAASRDAAAEIVKEKPKIDDWKTLGAFVEESLVEIARKVREAEREKRDLEAKQRVAADEIARLTSGSTLSRKKILLTFDAEQAAAAAVEVSYLILGTGWVPFYDIHADVERGEVMVVYYGQILQATGEDWRQAEISLSTAHPAKSASMPELRADVVGVSAIAQVVQHKGGQAFYGNELQRNWSDLNRIIMAQQDAILNKQELVALNIMASQISSHVFRIRLPQSVPSDGSPHRVTIAESRLKATFERVTTPKLSPHVYLKSRLKNGSDFPYMPGEMNLFLGNDFVGTSGVELVSPGEEFEVFLSADETVKVTRKLESKRFEAGTLQKVHYTYSIRVENFKTKAVTVSVIDQLPISRDSDIEVLAERDMTPPTSRDNEGKLTWRLDLAPGESKEIRLSYRVYVPAAKSAYTSNR